MYFYICTVIDCVLEFEEDFFCMTCSIRCFLGVGESIMLEAAGFAIIELETATFSWVAENLLLS